MRCDPTPHQSDGDIDGHARRMYVCLLNQAGESRLQRNLKARPALWRKARAPDRAKLGVGVAWGFTGDGRADLCGCEGLPFALGLALGEASS